MKTAVFLILLMFAAGNASAMEPGSMPYTHYSYPVQTETGTMWLTTRTSENFTPGRFRKKSLYDPSNPYKVYPLDQY